MIDQMGCGFHHPARIARGTDPSCFARDPMFAMLLTYFPGSLLIWWSVDESFVRQAGITAERIENNETMKIYADTSVFGGVFDQKFSEPSRMVIVISAYTRH